MKVLMINVVCGIRSTGRICTDLADALEKNGHTVKIAYGRGYVPQEYQKYAVRIGTDLSYRMDGFKSRIFDSAGFNSIRETQKFVLWVKEFDPDIIHLHNLHGYYINISILFEYIRTCGKRIIWTLHDCWAFTGHCAYFDYAQCDNWKNGCIQCLQKREYPKSVFLSKANDNYKRKKLLFTNISNLEIVTPSHWLNQIVAESFLASYPCETIHNSIDTNIFKYTESDILERNHLLGKKVVLGVASVWDKRKGLDYFLKLAEVLPEEYRIVLIGLSQKQIKDMPKSIVAFSSTNNINELIQWYSAAYIFFNPTLEDNYPSTNLEAQACGTPVLTFDTGGSPESAVRYGTVTDKDITSIKRHILFDSYIRRSDSISVNTMVIKYMNLYEEVD